MIRKVYSYCSSLLRNENQMDRIIEDYAYNSAEINRTPVKPQVDIIKNQTYSLPKLTPEIMKNLTSTQIENRISSLTNSEICQLFDYVGGPYDNWSDGSRVKTELKNIERGKYCLVYVRQTWSGVRWKIMLPKPFNKIGYYLIRPKQPEPEINTSPAKRPTKAESFVVGDKPGVKPVLTCW